MKWGLHFYQLIKEKKNDLKLIFYTFDHILAVFLLENLNLFDFIKKCYSLQLFICLMINKNGRVDVWLYGFIYLNICVSEVNLQLLCNNSRVNSN